ncbi:hypothetical protein BDR03DRAFT_1018963 [Suillus americanus]|nr:hypothetical protein BDR03DRAFT_1018963 [Suillus americanus]
MAARGQLVDQTRRNVKANLAEANLPDQRVYVVSSSSLRAVAKGEQPSRKRKLGESAASQDGFLPEELAPRK